MSLTEIGMGKLLPFSLKRPYRGVAAIGLIPDQYGMIDASDLRVSLLGDGMLQLARGPIERIARSNHQGTYQLIESKGIGLVVYLGNAGLLNAERIADSLLRGDLGREFTGRDLSLSALVAATGKDYRYGKTDSFLRLSELLAFLSHRYQDQKSEQRRQHGDLADVSMIYSAMYSESNPSQVIARERSIFQS